MPSWCMSACLLYTSFSKKQAEEQHKLGKLTAEERIGKIVDAGSFVEIDKYLERSNAVLGYPDVCAPGEGVVAGWATIEGRPVYLFAQDYTVLKGSLGAAHAAKITKVMDCLLYTSWRPKERAAPPM